VVFVVAKVIVFAFAVPRVERMIPKHIEGFFRQAVLADVINVFVVPPGHEDTVESTSFFIDAALV